MQPTKHSLQCQRKFVHKLSIVRFLIKKKSKILYNMCPVTFNFQDTRHRQTAQAIKLSNHGRLVVTRGLRPFEVRRQCAARHSFQHALLCWHRPLSQLPEVLPRDLRQSWEGLHKRAP
jgi:hypothetical protein